MNDPRAVADAVMKRYAEHKEQVIVEHVGILMRGTVKVTIRKPRRMPERLYRWLMRTIVVEASVPSVEVNRGHGS